MSGPHPAVAATRVAVRETLDGCELGTRVWVALSGGPGFPGARRRDRVRGAQGGLLRRRDHRGSRAATRVG